MLRLLNKTMVHLTLFTLVLAVSGATAAGPTEVAKEVIDKVLEILNNPADAGEAKKDYRQQLVKQLVDRHFDYQEMAKRSLGLTWTKLNPGQRDEFVRLFAELLEASYADKIDKYAKHIRIDYTGESLDGEYAEVRTVVVRPNDRIPLSYRMLSGSGGWMVYDVVIEGISLVNNYRTQFREILANNKPEALLDILRKKVGDAHAS